MDSHKKGQLSMLDLYIGVFLFIILITFILITWATYSNKLNERILYEQMEIKALQVSDILVKSPGSPSAWEKNVSTLRVPGLAENDRVLSKEKVDSFIMDVTYDNLTQMYNLENYNIYLKIAGIEGGRNPEVYGPSNIAVSVRRQVIYENVSAEVQIVLWQ